MENETPAVKECRPCVIGMAIAGMLVGLAFIYIAIDVMTDSSISRMFIKGESDTDDD